MSTSVRVFGFLFHLTMACVLGYMAWGAFQQGTVGSIIAGLLVGVLAYFCLLSAFLVPVLPELLALPEKDTTVEAVC